MAINFNGKGNPWNIAYNSSTPNVYYVKDSSGNYLGVKPYQLTGSIPGGAIYLRNSHLVQSDEKKMGEGGYITSSGQSSYYNYAASIKYVLYYDDKLTPNTTTSTRPSGSLRGNIFEDDSPLILFDAATVDLVGSIYGENNKPYVYVGSTGTNDDSVDLKVRLCLGEYNTSTQQMNGGLSIDYSKCVPNTYEDGAYTYQGNGVFIETYDNAQITISKNLYHYMCQKQLSPTVDTTVSPTQTEGAQIPIGGTVYYKDLLDFDGTLIQVDNGFNNEWSVNGPGVISIPSISGSMDSDYGEFNFPSSDMRYYRFRVEEKGCSSSSATSLSTGGQWYETIPYWFGTTYMNEVGYNYTKQATISGTVYFSGASQGLTSKTVTNPDYPSISQPSLSGSIQNDVLNNDGTSYIKLASFSVYNPNNFAVTAVIGYAKEGYSGVTTTRTISAKGTYYGDEEEPDYNYIEIEAYFKAYATTSSTAYLELQGSSTG